MLRMDCFSFIEVVDDKGAYGDKVFDHLIEQT